MTSPLEKRGDYILAARDLASFRFDRSAYEDRLILQLVCMGLLGAAAITIGVAYGPGTYEARLLGLPLTGLYLVLSGLMIVDWVQRLRSSPLWPWR